MQAGGWVCERRKGYNGRKEGSTPFPSNSNGYSLAQDMSLGLQLKHRPHTPGPEVRMQNSPWESAWTLGMFVEASGPLKQALQPVVEI